MPKSLLARFLLAYLAALLLVALVPQYVQFKENASASSTWLGEQNEYSEAEIRRQQLKAHLIKFGIEAIIALPIAALLVRIHALSTAKPPH